MTGVFVVMAVLSMMAGSMQEDGEEAEQPHPHAKARSRIRDITNIITTRLKSLMGTPSNGSAESSNTDKGRNDTLGRSEDDPRVFPTTTQAEDADAFLQEKPARNAKDSTADCHSKGEFCDAEKSSTSDDSDVPDAVLSEGEESSSSSDEDHPGAAPEGKEHSSSSSSSDDDDGQPGVTPEGEESSSSSSDDEDHPGAAPGGKEHSSSSSSSDNDNDDDGKPGATPEGEESSSSSSSDDDQPGVEVSNTLFSDVPRDDKNSIRGDDAVYHNNVLYDAEESSTSDDDVDSTSSSEDDHGASLSPEHFMLDDHLPGGAPPPMSVPIEDIEGNAADDELGDNDVCNSLEGNAPCNDMGDVSVDLYGDSDDNADFYMEDDTDYDDVSDYDYDTESDSDDEDSDDNMEGIFIEGEGGALVVEHRNISNGPGDAGDLHGKAHH